MQIDSIILLDAENPEMFNPFSALHPLWEIRTGALRVFEKIELEFPRKKIIFSGRHKHTVSFLQRFNKKNAQIGSENILILRSNILFNSFFWNELTKTMLDTPDRSFVIVCNGQKVGAFLHKNNYVENLTKDELSDPNSQFFKSFSHITFEDTLLINNISEFITHNKEALESDMDYFRGLNKFSNKSFLGVSPVGHSKIYFGSHVNIMPNVVLDGSHGGIIISDNVTIEPNVFISGPVYIGNNSLIKAGTRIYSNTSIGNNCKVSGEVSGSIMQSFVNKQHEGFLGHSFISEWVNLGAGTTNSNLKNNYLNVKIMLGEIEIRTNNLFMGLICGDHTRTAINTRFNTGTVCGISSMILSSDFPPTSIKSFSFGGERDSPKYDFKKAVSTIKSVMSRRNKDLLPVEEELLAAEFIK
jgi:UDP-N-acetylglucosamine diphosphorylase/glucosamine-1-phosphate N-acetyltransferase